MAGNPYDRFRVSPHDPSTLRSSDVERTLRTLAESSGGRLSVEKLAESFERRPIFLAKIGRGPRRVFLWTQMHGDEPTHTAVVLDLISYLIQTPAEPAAANILAGCTLWIVPLVNPDGAERTTRINAQHIDVNRDAWRLQTPEGRALQQAAAACRPKFAFSLHNQNARAAVGDPPRPAAVAVMATPVDHKGTVTAEVRAAKQIAACFVAAVRERIDGMICRYETEYMPQAFGEAIQALGAATVLVEAGGWPEADPTPMVKVHFHGLLAALDAIATDRYRDVDPAEYDSLPGPNEQKLLDCVIKGGHVIDVPSGALFKADLGVNFSDGQRLHRGAKPDGRIVDVGDSSVTAGKLTIAADGHLALPGRIAWVEDMSLSAPPSSDLLDSLLAAGVTTAVGMVDLNGRRSLDAISATANLPVNWGYILGLDGASDAHDGLIDRVVLAISRGILGATGESIPPRIREYLEWFGIPVLTCNQLPPPQTAAGSYAEMAQQTWELYKLLGFGEHRGRIRRESFADLQLFEVGEPVAAATAVDRRKLRQVMVAGVRVWENGRRTGANPGQFLRRSASATGNL